MPLEKISKDQMRELEKKVGNDLLKKHGKKRFYTPAQVQSSCKDLNIAIDWHCWAMCFFTDRSAFELFHESIGENCDYTSMKSSMVSAITDGASDSWTDFDFDLSWIELPDIDFSDFFDFFDF